MANGRLNGRSGNILKTYGIPLSIVVTMLAAAVGYGELKGQVTDTKSDVSVHLADREVHTGLQVDVGSLKADVSNVKESVDGINTKLQSLEGKVSDLAVQQASDASAINAKLDALLSNNGDPH